MRVCIHRGAKQIGGSCVEIESCGQRLIVDFGLPLDAEDDKEQYIPDIQGLDGTDESLLGILISHPHLDHFGLLPYISPKIPVGMGPAARNIIKAAAPFLPGEHFTLSEGWDFKSGQVLNIGPFHITPYLVDHAAYDSYAFKIESNGKSLFYSGDFRAHGRKGNLFERLIANPPTNIDVLLLEGSSLGRISKFEQFPSESDLENEFVKVIQQTQGLTMFHTSAQNIDRVVSIYRASKRTGRKLIIDLYAATILAATGNQNIPQSDWDNIILYVPRGQQIQIKKRQCFSLLQSHSKNRKYLEDLQGLSAKATLLFRPLHCFDLEKAQCLTGSSYIYSQWSGYWGLGSYSKLPDWIARNDIKEYHIHTSGHAGPKALQQFVSAMNPATVVPIHSFYPEQYNELFSNVKPYNDKQWWEV